MRGKGEGHDNDQDCDGNGVGARRGGDVAMKARPLTVLAVAAGIAATTIAMPGGPATSSAVPASGPSPAACNWVTADEAAGILGESVTADTLLDDPGSAEISCVYHGSEGDGVESDLRLPGAFKTDAAAQFALAAAGNVATVGGLGVKSVCVVEPRTTPPSSTVVVLLSGDRLYRATGWYAQSCDTLRRFAEVAIGRIGG